MQSIIELEGLCKTYGGQSRVLDQVHLRVARGEFLYVVGGTGAGKSSLLRMLATEEAASSGKISLFGHDLRSVTPNTLRAIRRLIGYVPQDLQLISDLSVFDNVALALTLGGKALLGADARQKVNRQIEVLGLGAKRNSPVRELSGGESQRVAVARALVRDPELVVADEPTGSQDHDQTWAIMDLLVKANGRGATVLVATHDREITRKLRRRCALLRAGKLSLEESAHFLMK